MDANVGQFLLRQNVSDLLLWFVDWSRSLQHTHTHNFYSSSESKVGLFYSHSCSLDISRSLIRCMKTMKQLNKNVASHLVTPQRCISFCSIDIPIIKRTWQVGKQATESKLPVCTRDRNNQLPKTSKKKKTINHIRYEIEEKQKQKPLMKSKSIVL